MDAAPQGMAVQLAPACGIGQTPETASRSARGGATLSPLLTAWSVVSDGTRWCEMIIDTSAVQAPPS